jgi:hypothetical protein
MNRRLWNGMGYIIYWRWNRNGDGKGRKFVSVT